MDDLLGGEGRGGAGARGIGQGGGDGALQGGAVSVGDGQGRCGGGPAGPPLAGGVRRAAHLPGERLVAPAGRRAEDDPDPQRQRLRAGRSPEQRGQHRVLGRGDRNGERGGAGGHRASWGAAAAAATSRYRPILAQPFRNFRDPVLALRLAPCRGHAVLLSAQKRAREWNAAPGRWSRPLLPLRPSTFDPRS